MTNVRKFSQFIPATLQEAVGLAGGANAIGPTSGGGGASITYMFTQSTAVVPPLYLGAAVRVDEATGLWECCLATTPLLAEFYGFIVAITGTTYTVQFGGPVAPGVPLLTGLVAGTPYYLSDTVAGGISPMPPALANEINLPVLWAMDNGNSVIRMSRGFINGGSTGSGGGGGNTPPNNVVNVVQPGNTFNLGDILYISADNTFALGNAYSTLAAAQAEWVVTGIPIANNTFTIQQGGQIKGLIAHDGAGGAIVSSTLYYLSDVIGQEGKLTAVKPNTVGHYAKPLYIQQVLSSNTGWMLDQIAEVVAPAPVINGTIIQVVSGNSTTTRTVAPPVVMVPVNVPSLGSPITLNTAGNQVKVTFWVSSGVNSGSINFALFRNGVQVTGPTPLFSGPIQSGSFMAGGFVYVDAPGGVGPYTYTLGVAVTNPGATISINTAAGLGAYMTSWVLEEIG